MDFLKKAAEIVESHGRSIPTTVERVSPLDDVKVWRAEPMFTPPSDVLIGQEQRWINDMMGVAAGGEPIYKLVWNGDREYWHEFFHAWYSDGRPSEAPTKRPRVRYQTLKNPQTKKFSRDIFPPRWLILRRLDIEHFADNWKAESWVFAPEIGCMKQIRPEEPPKVFWMPYMTVSRHTDYCCGTAANEKRKCFGKYEPPDFARTFLENQKAADHALGSDMLASIGYGFAVEIEEEQNGYLGEIRKLEVEAAIAIEHPWALLGVEATMRAGIDSTKQARQLVKEHYDKQIQDAAKLL